MSEMDKEDEIENIRDDEQQNVERKRIRLLRPQTSHREKVAAKEERRQSNLRKVSMVLQKPEEERTEEDLQILTLYPYLLDECQERLKKREAIKKRLEEFEDPDDILTQKCQILAQAIAQSQHLVVYTGAGISTAAKIPDYRGPDGIWTRLKEGKEIGDHDLSLAEPTYTHMALYELYRQKILKYVVSQNCDGLHLRSGLPRTALSELHGNMYIEVCKSCKPHKEYWRLFDVTESTARYAHKTYRRCYVCNGSLVDSIVHFGERGSLQWPLNWSGACKNAKEATTIICLGSSLKVLKKYPWLWQMDKPLKKRPNLYIVNLQWTPKDDVANVKIHGRCDTVFKKIMDMLGVAVPRYSKARDPIFHHFTPLHDLEIHTNTRPCLVEDMKEAPSVDEKYYYKLECDKTALTLEAGTACGGVGGGGGIVLNSLLSNLYMFLYPYQTSLLYSGLHSIINPPPVTKEEQEVPPSTSSSVSAEPSCDFCYKQYKNVSCQFYRKMESNFEKQLFRYSKVEKQLKANACVCCDYTTEEEDVVEEVEPEKSGGASSTKGGGWFGKGYRKGRTKFKRKI